MFRLLHSLCLQLSIEDNELKSLAGIEPLVNLMELYAGEWRCRVALFDHSDAVALFCGSGNWQESCC